MALNLNQAKFLKAYLKSGNATQAAIEAGYSEASAASIGSELLRKPEITEAIERAVTKLELTTENVLAEVMKLAFSNMGDFVQPSADGTQLVPDFSMLTRDQMAAIQEVKVDESGGGGGDGKRERIQRTTFKLASKIDALQLLMRNLRLLNDKVEITLPNEIIKKLTEGRKRVNGNG